MYTFRECFAEMLSITAFLIRKHFIKWAHSNGNTTSGLLNEDGTINNEKTGEIFKDGPTYGNMVKLMNVLYSIGAVLATPAVCDGTVFFGSTDGNIYALQ